MGLLDSEIHRRCLSSFFSQKEIFTSGECSGPNGEWIQGGSPVGSLLGPLESQLCCTIRPMGGRDGFSIVNHNQQGTENSFSIAQSIFGGSVFRFLAQRSSSGRGAFAGTAQLMSDASNLARALLDLNRAPNVLDTINSHMSEIFPSIRWVVAAPLQDNGSEVQISVSAYDKSESRPDLLVPLSECGTGVGQVLAILLAATSYKQPKLILVDEPNSFLHPSAAKRLIEILRKYDHHQYILTTHSAEIVVAAKPSTLHHTKWTGTESIVENLSGGEVQKTQLALADIGVQISDVFGANEILWVEGQTEQMCFPKLIEVAKGSNFRNAKVLALRSTSEVDHNRPSAKLVREIYEALSQSNALVPRAVGFRLDRESRNDDLIESLENDTSKQIRFLCRKNYECYLIHPAALASLFAQVEFEEDIDLSQGKIEAAIRMLGDNKELRAARYWKSDIGDPVWLKHVDGAKLLQMLFKALTNSQLEYKKTTHSVALTEWLIANDLDHIQELIDFVSW
jgi:hypothetical protein